MLKAPVPGALLCIFCTVVPLLAQLVSARVLLEVCYQGCFPSSKMVAGGRFPAGLDEHVCALQACAERNAYQQHFRRDRGSQTLTSKLFDTSGEVWLELGRFGNPYATVLTNSGGGPLCGDLDQLCSRSVGWGGHFEQHHENLARVRANSGRFGRSWSMSDHLQPKCGAVAVSDS